MHDKVAYARAVKLARFQVKLVKTLARKLPRGLPGRDDFLPGAGRELTMLENEIAVLAGAVEEVRRSLSLPANQPAHAEAISPSRSS
jgi:hypothetical protein